MKLLTDEEIERVIGEDLRYCYSGHIEEYRAIAQTQLAKDEAECQKRIKELIERIELRMETKYWESHFLNNDNRTYHMISSDVWQALKKQEGVDVS